MNKHDDKYSSRKRHICLQLQPLILFLDTDEALKKKGFFHSHFENLHDWRKLPIPIPGIHNGTEGSITFPRLLMLFLRYSTYKYPGRVQHFKHYPQNLIIEAVFKILYTTTHIKIQHKIKVNLKLSVCS